MSSYRSEWIERSAVIEARCSAAAEARQFIGGRFVFASEDEECRRISDLRSRGFALCDSGQCEVVAGRVVAMDPESIRGLVRELRDLAAQWGTRLQSIEAGTPETGEAAVLAGETGYEPWWSVR